MQVTKQEVLLVIPTFRPTRSVISIIEKLKLTTIVSDDCSPVTFDPILREVSALPRTTVVRNLHNQGIARGLNQGLELAASHRFEWLLTVDQDSDLDGDYARAILSAAQSHEALWIQRPAIGVIGIDAVDAAACLHLREAGYLIALTDTVELYHNLGDSHQVNILGKTVMVTNHSPARRATMVRNRLRLAPAEFKQSPVHAARTLRRVTVNSLMGGLTGTDRWEKTKGSLSGLRRKKPNK
jgi:GT2 family glycosyltransferase